MSLHSLMMIRALRIGGLQVLSLMKYRKKDENVDGIGGLLPLTAV